MSEEAITEEVTTATEEVSEVVETAAPETTTSTKEEKAFVDSFLEQLTDDEVKDAKFWGNLAGKDADELGRYVKELNSFAGKKGDIPKSDASEEEWNAFYAKLGRPDSIEGYEFAMSDEFKELAGEGASFFEKAVEGFKEQSFKLGLDPKKADELVDWYLDMAANQITDVNKTIEESMTGKDESLRKEWGDEYDGLMTGNKAMLKRFGMDEGDISAMESAGVLKEPALAVALAKINSQFADDPQIGHMQTKTVAGLKDQLSEVNQEIMGYIKKGDPVPSHIAGKRIDLMDRLGEDL